jgi:hypothetical protein
MRTSGYGSAGAIMSWLVQERGTEEEPASIDVSGSWAITAPPSP